MKRLCVFLACVVFVGVNYLQAQTVQITGTVTGAEDGMPIPGASVQVKGTTIGTATNAEGQYTLGVPQDATTLSFSFLGYSTQEVEIGGRTTINVALEPDALALEEIIVSGVAGATPKRKMSVSVSSVDAEALQAVPATSAAGALQGKVSGVTIVQSSGNPGQGSSIRLRGATSLLGDSSPLLIVDGVMYEGSLADINVDDIENIEVVKGASASALYGSRAGAGVIVIRTRRGNSAKEGTTTVRLRNEYGISQLPSKIDLAEHHAYQLADDWQDYDEFTKYAGISYPADYAGGRNEGISGNRLVTHARFADQPYARLFDQQEKVFQDGSYFTNYASIAHNAGKTSIFTSFENTHNSGIVWNTDGSRRQNFRLNADHWIGDKISLQASSFVSQNKMDVADGRFVGGWGGGQGSAFFDMLFFEPDIDFEMDAPAGVPGSALPKYFIHPNHWQTDNGNPLHALYYAKRETERKNVLQSFQGNYYATDWLNFNAAYSIEKFNTLRTDYEPRGMSRSQQYDTNGLMYKYSSEGISQVVSFTSNFNKSFGELLIKGKLSYLYEDYSTDNFSVNATNFNVSSVPSLDAIAGDEYNTIRSAVTQTRARNFFAIVDGDYKDRYIFSALFRYDGSSLFGENNRWNPYFRVSGAYRISQDIEIPGVDEFKIRAAYGTSGQRPGFNYQYETYSMYQGSISKSTIGNKDLKPSETAEFEVGLNLEFLGMFDFEATYSDINTEGAFYNVPLPAASGFLYQWQNAADIHATALEMTLGVAPIRTPDFNWHMSFNFDKITQEVSKLEAPAFRVGPTINSLQTFYIREGEPFGIMYGGDWVRTLEEMETQLADGDDISNYTVNADGYVIVNGTEGTVNEAPIRLLDENGDDAFVQIADMNPDFNLSWNNSFTYKGVNFNMLWHWKQGGQVYNQTKQWLYRDERHGDFDQTDKPLNEKKTTTYYQAFYRVNEPNSYFAEDGTYLKLREASLYYTFNKESLAGVGMNFLQGIKVGVIGRNLLTFTKYSGWDPEVSQQDYAEGNPSLYYVDMFNYPNYRMFTFSVELTF